LADDHRPPLGRMLRDLEPELGELGHEPVGRALAVGKMSRRRRYRRDLEKGEQPLYGPPLFGVDLGQNLVARGHLAPPSSKVALHAFTRCCSRSGGPLPTGRRRWRTGSIGLPSVGPMETILVRREDADGAAIRRQERAV